MKIKYKQSLRALTVMLIVLGMLLMPLSAFAEGDGDGSGVEVLGDPGEPANEGGGDGGNADSGSNHGDVGDIGDGDSNAVDNSDGDDGNNAVDDEGDEIGDSSGSTDNEGSNNQGSDNKGSGGSDFGDNNADITNNNDHANQSVAVDPGIVKEDEKFDGNTYAAVIEYENLDNPGNPLILGDLGLFVVAFTEIGKSRIGSVRITIPKEFQIDSNSLRWEFDFTNSKDSRDEFKEDSWGGVIKDNTLSLWATAVDYYLYFGESLKVIFNATTPSEFPNEDTKYFDLWSHDKNIGVYRFETEAWTNATNKDGKPLSENVASDSQARVGVGTDDRQNERSDKHSQLRVWVGNDNFKENRWEYYINEYRAFLESDNRIKEGYAVFEKPKVFTKPNDYPDGYVYDVDLLEVKDEKDIKRFIFGVYFEGEKLPMTDLEIILPKGFVLSEAHSDPGTVTFNEKENKLTWQGSLEGKGNFKIVIVAKADNNADRDFYVRGFVEGGGTMHIKTKYPDDQIVYPGGNLAYNDWFKYVDFFAGSDPIIPGTGPGNGDDPGNGSDNGNGGDNDTGNGGDDDNSGTEGSPDVPGTRPGTRASG